jgi:hypothetical protein
MRSPPWTFSSPSHAPASSFTESSSQNPVKQQQQFLVKDSIFAPDLPEYPDFPEYQVQKRYSPAPDLPDYPDLPEYQKKSGISGAKEVIQKEFWILTSGF